MLLTDVERKTSTEARPAELQCRFLTPAEREQFARDGFVIVRGLADDALRREMLEVTHDHLAREIGPIEYEADLHYPGAPSSLQSEGGRTVRRLKQAHSRHAVFTEWLSSPALLGRLAQLLGPQIVAPLVHHNCIMTKQPRFSSETGWHQDIRYWSFQRPELVNVWLALGHEEPHNGCLRLIPGSHRLSLDRDRYDDALFLRPDQPENQALMSTAVEAALEPGDVLLFHCRTFHAAGRNETGAPKFSVVFTFRPADNLPLPGTRSAAMPELLLPRTA
jgi:phytanoyl-CoA hydroxylase